jgi:hypothetical protein
MSYSIAYNSGSTVPFGTYKQGNILMGLKPQEYTVSSGFTWYANATTPNDNYLIISDTYSQGWSTQQESKPTIWRSETGTTESFVSLVNQLPDVNGITGFTDSGTAMKYLMDSGKYFVNKDDYLGLVSDNLVLNIDAGWYPSYSGSGTTWKDIKGTNNGTLINGPTFSTDGGGSIVFDGIDDRSTFPTSSDFAFGSGNLSIEVWYKRINRFDPYPRICQFGTGWNNSQCWAFLDGHAVWGSTKFSVHIFAQNGNTSNLLTSNTTVSSDTWYYLVLTRNSSLWTLYVNSSVDKTATWAGQPDNGISNTFQIAGAAYGNDDFSNSKITNLRLYKRVLTSDEVLQNYNATKGRFGL